MRRLILMAVLACAWPAVAPAQTRAITETDLLTFVWVADPQISPDGTRVAFVRVTVDDKGEGYQTSIWLAPADGAEAPRQLTGGTRDSSPRWSPDGARLAFVRSPEKDGRPQPAQIFVMAMAGGEARALTDMPRGAGNPAWSPDGTSLAFTSTARPDEIKKADAKKEAAGDAKKDAPRVSDVRVIRDPVYRANGIADFGFVESDRPSHIWIVPAPVGVFETQTARQITSGEFGVGNVAWSRDGRRLFFVSDRRKDNAYLPNDSDLYAVSRDGGEPQRVASIDGGIGPFAESPDGARIAFVGTLAGNPERSYSQSDLWIADATGSEPRNLTAEYDFDINGGLGGDQRAPRGSHPSGPIWSADGRSILIKVGEHGDANLKRVDAASGRVTPLTTGHQEVMSYTADAKAQRLAAVISTQTVIGDLHLIPAVGSGPQKAATKITGFNDALFSSLTLSEPEEVWYDSFDGTKIQAWILKPSSFDASRTYPLIVEIHGGPHSAYGNTFTHEFQWMAAKGYVVFFTNPRGSSNYGQDFGNIIQFKYPGDDAKDILTGVDWLLKEKRYVDADRMGVTGGSGGGLLTNWIVTQTNRFKAAVSQRDISDWTAFWYTADFTLFTPFWFRKAPFEDPEEFAQRSPITFVEKIETPLLFILGDEDWRTPPSAGGEPLFRALKYLKKEAVMVRFPDENHDLSRSGQPWHRIERLQHIVGWFDKYIGG